MEHGVGNVADSTEILFDEGIIGVPRARRFELLQRDGSPVRVLRCLDINGFALPVVDPRLADPGYWPDVKPWVAEALGLRAEEPILVLAVATLESEEILANLRAPLFINPARRVGAQVILDDRSYSLRARVVQER